MIRATILYGGDEGWQNQLKDIQIYQPKFQNQTLPRPAGDSV
jgi:hypothetical protein